MNGQQRVTIPDTLMRAIKSLTSAAGDGTLDEADAFTAVIMLTHGWSLWRTSDKIDPSAVAIPRSQWLEISELLVHMPGTPIGKVNRGLDWMNSGPSAYEDARAVPQ